jgi:hypothetical protein
MTIAIRPAPVGAPARRHDMVCRSFLAIVIVCFAQQANSISTQPTGSPAHVTRFGAGIGHGDSNKLGAIGSA